jgi:peptidoglycan hydrolase CwlO-like protein
LSIPEQIRSLEDLAAIDAELKILDEQLNQERSTLTTLKGNLKRLEEKLKNDTTERRRDRQGAQRARHRRSHDDAAARAFARQAQSLPDRA